MIGMERFFSSLLSQISRFLPVLIWMTMVNVALAAAVIFAWQFYNVNPAWFYKDPNVVADQPFYIGSLSNIGAILWIASATASFFAYFVSRRLDTDVSERSLIFIAGISALFGVDDLLMIHDGLFPAISLPGELMYVLQATLCLVWIFLHYKTILEGPWFLAISGFGFLGASLGFDIVSDQLFYFEGMVAIEDAFKLLGISLWFAYATIAAFERILKVARAQARSYRA